MNEADYLERQMTLFPTCLEPQEENTQNISSGKTYLEHFQATKGVTFKPCSAKSHKPIFQCLDLDDGQEAEWYEVRDVISHGESLTLNIGASPSIVRESSLLRVLEIGGVDRKYYLSPKACQGILRRAKARKKRLPELLYQVLKHQSMISETDKQTQ